MGRPRALVLKELIETMPHMVSIHQLGEPSDPAWEVTFYDEHGEIKAEHDDPMSNHITLAQGEPDLVRALLKARNLLPSWKK